MNSCLCVQKKNLWRRYFGSKVAISKGTVLSPDMFVVKVGEPKGIPPENMQNLVGKKIKVDVKEDDNANISDMQTFPPK
uniref:AFP-like domain-containing protein n=1 Tax=Astatotilapia calliptera TaxID=8154 RepID=A0A3P8N6T1_ASTCA